MTKIEGARCGNVISMKVTINISNVKVNAGEDVAYFYIPEDIHPLVISGGIGIRDSRVITIIVDVDGKVTLRNTSSSTFEIGDAIYACITYLSY